MAYREFRRGLEPRWARVWADLAVAYLVLAGVVAGLLLWAPGLPVAIPAAAAGALVIGYAVNAIANFLHEAGHYNLVPGRPRNDRVANVLFGWLLGTSVASYRHTHMQHHRALGTTMDAEISYFDALRISYLVESLFGIRALRVIARLREADKDIESRRAGTAGDDEGSRLPFLALAAVANLAITAGLVLAGGIAAAAAWVAGLALVFPFFASVRQVLEHRSEDADPDVDYGEVDHGPVNRLFGQGPVSSTLGSAGFNRHALHHWEPTLSYTRLADVEAYLLRTPQAELVRERQTSYHATFLRLLELS